MHLGVLLYIIWASVPVSLAIEAQILFTVLCAGVCLLGVTWFNRSLDLIKVHLLDGKKKLVTSGPFAYVRHPLQQKGIGSGDPMRAIAAY